MNKPGYIWLRLRNDPRGVVPLQNLHVAGLFHAQTAARGEGIYPYVYRYSYQAIGQAGQV